MACSRDQSPSRQEKSCKGHLQHLNMTVESEQMILVFHKTSHLTPNRSVSASLAGWPDTTTTGRTSWVSEVKQDYYSRNYGSRNMCEREKSLFDLPVPTENASSALFQPQCTVLEGSSLYFMRVLHCAIVRVFTAIKCTKGDGMLASQIK